MYIPETKGVPLEEIAALFGDQEEVVIFSANIHVDHNTHELVVDTPGGAAVNGVVTQKCEKEVREIEKV